MALFGCKITAVVIVESCLGQAQVWLFITDSILLLLAIKTSHDVVNFKAYLLSKSSHVFLTLKIQNPGSFWKRYALIGFLCTCCYFIPEKRVQWTRNKVIKSSRLADWKLNQQRAVLNLTLKRNFKTRQRDRQKNRQTHAQINRETLQINRYRQTDRQANRWTNRQTERQTNKQTDRQTGRQTNCKRN